LRSFRPRSIDELNKAKGYEPVRLHIKFNFSETIKVDNKIDILFGNTWEDFGK